MLLCFSLNELPCHTSQVFSYLKRLGYVVTRTKPPTSYYPTPPNTVIVNTAPSILQRIRSLFPTLVSWPFRLCGGFDWWRPMRISRWLHHDKNYGELLRKIHECHTNKPPSLTFPFLALHSLGAWSPSTTIEKC